MWRGSLITVVIAIAIPEIPRVTRLVRSLVLSIREEPYVEAAISLGTPTTRSCSRHILPNTVAPLIVQGTFICASASWSRPSCRSWGGPAARHPDLGQRDGRGPRAVQRVPAQHLLPGIFLAVTVLAVNILGDGLRDTLDPKMAKRAEHADMSAILEVRNLSIGLPARAATAHRRCAT
jgi:peptide/nickel transport system permease protein